MKWVAIEKEGSLFSLMAQNAHSKISYKTEPANQFWKLESNLQSYLCIVYYYRSAEYCNSKGRLQAPATTDMNQVWSGDVCSYPHIS